MRKGSIAPRDTEKAMFLHNFVMELTLGRPLEYDELVVHLNGVGYDCRGSNLEKIRTCEVHLYQRPRRSTTYVVTERKFAPYSLN